MGNVLTPEQQQLIDNERSAYNSMVANFTNFPPLPPKPADWATLTGVHDVIPAAIRQNQYARQAFTQISAREILEGSELAIYLPTHKLFCSTSTQPEQTTADIIIYPIIGGSAVYYFRLTFIDDRNFVISVKLGEEKWARISTSATLLGSGHLAAAFTGPTVGFDEQSIRTGVYSDAAAALVGATMFSLSKSPSPASIINLKETSYVDLFNYGTFLIGNHDSRAYGYCPTPNRDITQVSTIISKFFPAGVTPSYFQFYMVNGHEAPIVRHVKTLLDNLQLRQQRIMGVSFENAGLERAAHMLRIAGRRSADQWNACIANPADVHCQATEASEADMLNFCAQYPEDPACGCTTTALDRRFTEQFPSAAATSIKQAAMANLSCWPSACGAGDAFIFSDKVAAIGRGQCGVPLACDMSVAEQQRWGSFAECNRLAAQAAAAEAARIEAERQAVEAARIAEQDRLSQLAAQQAAQDRQRQEAERIAAEEAVRKALEEQKRLETMTATELQARLAQLENERLTRITAQNTRYAAQQNTVDQILVTQQMYTANVQRGVYSVQDAQHAELLNSMNSILSNLQEIKLALALDGQKNVDIDQDIRDLQAAIARHITLQDQLPDNSNEQLPDNSNEQLPDNSNEQLPDNGDSDSDDNTILIVIIVLCSILGISFAIWAIRRNPETAKDIKQPNVMVVENAE